LGSSRESFQPFGATQVNGRSESVVTSQPLGVAAIAAWEPVTPSTETKSAIDVMSVPIGVRQTTLEKG
jgi:hypothetical protein